MVKRIVLISAVLLCVPGIARAQVNGSLGHVSIVPAQGAKPAAAASTDAPLVVSGFLGATMDSPDDWFFLGGDVRLPISNRPFVINPRLTFHPFDGGHEIQIDVNVIWDIELARPGRFRPYGGIGGAFVTDSFGGDSESKVGLNLVGGTRIALDQSRLQPFVQFQYTLIRDHFNVFAIAVGVGWPMR